ncbi:NUDIX domain-containing protein [Streptomyces filamentosus]|uniref:NUDIX domain-containing protein n=1 Tax=Streptomyces filamentosus TaxID=67294 RepID=UPI00123A2F2C|nr:NUDIX domain-containing protein [Streptomyces filamentosus]KAA6215651.1 NUDIX domain-containing protein [Streptomyces filamentosus]
MSGGRHAVPVDVHLLAVREGKNGSEVLLSRRAGGVYAAGLWHLPSGHVDGPFEDVVTALVRETAEETGLVLDPADVRAAVTVHHRAPSGSARIGILFEVRRWSGTPEIREPDVCDGMDWFPFDVLPDPMVAYCRAGLDAYRAGAGVALHFQEPDDPIGYDCDPALDRLRLVPGIGAEAGAGAAERGPGAAVKGFAERTVGRVAAWTDVSWARENSRVWQARGAAGGTWFVKVHQNEEFHRREVAALRGWVPGLGGAGPRLVAAAPESRAIVVTAVEGRPLHGMVLAGAEERAVFEAIGALAARVHASPLALHEVAGGGAPAGPYDRMERRLEAARALLEPGDEERVRGAVAMAQASGPLAPVVTHGDLQLRNLLLGADGTVRVIDFARSEPQPRVRDFVRFLDRFEDREDLATAFFTGYGRRPTPAEEAHLVAGAALDAVSGIAFGTRTGDPELVERGRRTLARLATGSVRPGALRPACTLPRPGVPHPAGTLPPAHGAEPIALAPSGTDTRRDRDGHLPAAALPSKAAPVSAPPPAGILVRACAVITNADELCLIHRRRPTGDQYSLPGGLRHLGESTTDALVRELAEELGFDALKTPEPPVLRWVQYQRTTRPRTPGLFERLHLVHTLTVPDNDRALIATTEQDADDGARVVWIPVGQAAGLHLYPAVGAVLTGLSDPPDEPVELPAMVDGTYVWR